MVNPTTFTSLSHHHSFEPMKPEILGDSFVSAVNRPASPPPGELIKVEDDMVTA